MKNRGAFTILFPFVLIAIVGMAALGVDASMLRVARSQLQTSTDAAALAGALELRNGTTATQDAAHNLLDKNSQDNNIVVSDNQVQRGQWNASTHTFVATDNNPNAVQVSATATPNLFFSQFFASTLHPITTSSIATTTPEMRDIILIVDLSPNMSQFSQLRSMPLLNPLNNLQQIYNALNVPAAGNMQWAPVLLTGSNAVIMDTLGLTNASYPYPSGSWDNYVSYVKTDVWVNNAGYRNRYGYLTFVNYLLAQRPTFVQTPPLWKTPEQPLQSVKDTVANFVNADLTNSDQLGLVTFNSATGGAVLEQALTTNFTAIPGILTGDPGANTPGRQAAFYSAISNVSPALDTAISHLRNNGRADAKKYIYVLSTGVFSTGSSGIITQAAIAAANHIIINVLQIGNSNLLLQQATFLTGGKSTVVQPTYTGNYELELAAMYTSNAQVALVQ